MSNDTILREHLVELLEGGHAHAKFDDAVAHFPHESLGIRPKGASHSAWEIVEHMRIAQHDILQFSISAEHVSPGWPEGYWPASAAPERESEWNQSLRSFRKDLTEFLALVQDPKQDLCKKFPWGSGQTLLREAMLIADHNSYHLGELVLVRRLLGAWPK
jgi:hypothetical protein